MDPRWVLRKTDKGRDEVATRAFRLGPRERSVLIVVDGKASVGEMVERLRHIPTAAEILDVLLRDDFVEMAAEAPAAAPVAPVPAARPAPPGAPDQSVLDAIRYARRFVLEAMGPSGDDLATKLEACRTRRELIPQLERAREVVLMAAGRRKADEFWAGLAVFLEAG